MKETLGDYLDFTRAERRGVFILSILIVLILIYPYLHSHFIVKENKDYSSFQQEISEWRAGIVVMDSSFSPQKDFIFENNSKNKSYDNNWKNEKGASSNEVALNPFSFNPNSATEKELLSLGLPQKTVNIILNYREKGGRFYQKEDLKKIFGFKEEWYQELLPFIQITKDSSDKNENIKGKEFSDELSKDKISLPQKPIVNTTNSNSNQSISYSIDINVADEVEFQKLRGIGPAFSKRIIKYRKALGGFVKIEQIGEVYGIADSTFQKIKPYLIKSTGTIQKININTATVDQFKSHPYLKWKMANAIVKYRDTHGKFTSVNDLENIYAIPKDVLKKLKPYLKVD